MADAPAGLAAALADRYRLERKLGQGGMATVYLAHDLKHDREVAVKVLRPDLAAVLGVDRFLSEIKVTANLQYPHILPLFDSGSADGFLYYVMPLVDGESLRDRLNREKQLGLEEALAIATQVAGALDYAHRQGVLHRDIKPENILLKEGQAILADFGIALAVKEAGGNRLTETGLSLGTPQYMSPEQATGDRALDARSDVYSLAAVLYELLAGEPPVSGPTAQAMIAKLMTTDPVPLRVLRSTVPEAVEAAVASALAKAPVDRPASAAAFAAALMSESPSAPVAMKRRRRTLVRLGSVLLGAALIAGGGWLIARHGPRQLAVSPFLSAIPVQLTTSGKASVGLPSPDGSLLAYGEEHCDGSVACRTDLIVKETAGEGRTTIATSIGSWLIPTSWSPDGRWLIYAEGNAETNVLVGTYMVSSRGGSPRRLGTGSQDWERDFVAPDTALVLVADSQQPWLRRVVSSTGQVVDSVPIPAGENPRDLQVAPDGSRLLIRVGRKFRLLGDSTTLKILDRRGHTTDSLRLDTSDDQAIWGGGPDQLVLSHWDQGAGASVLIQRRLDAGGRLLPAVDTLKVLTDFAILLGASADGQQLFYLMTRGGGASWCTMTRTTSRGAFSRGRRIEVPNSGAYAIGSLGGKWVLIGEATEGPSPPQWRLSVEPFGGGARHVLESALRSIPEVALSPADDSVGLAVEDGGGHLTIRSYPLPAGLPSTRGLYDTADLLDLRWLSGGLMATPLKSRPVVRVFGPHSEVRDIPIPDSLGRVIAVAQSPSAPELALTFAAPAVKTAGGNHLGEGLSIWRLYLDDGRLTLVTRTSDLRSSSGDASSWWTTDGWVQTAVNPSWKRTDPSLYGVPAEGGRLEAEPPLGVDGTARIMTLSRDGRRAVIDQAEVSADIWVLRASAKP
ncbi:MAG: protein kinase [Gemmatimonadales bacterium]